MSGAFLRKRSLDKKRNTESSSTTSETIITASFQQQVDNAKHLIDKFEGISYEECHKAVTQAISGIVQTKKNILISQRLIGYKECLILFAKYLQKVKLRGVDLSDQDCVIPFSVLRSVIDDINKLTQDEGKDKIIEEVGLAQPIFAVLEGMVFAIEQDSQKKERRPNLMRKASLKKVQQLPTVRPSSRGKLSSLQKSGTKLTNKKQLLNATNHKQEVVESIKQSAKEPTSIQQTVLKLLSIVKNLSANKNCRRSMLKQQFLRLLNRYFVIWNDKCMTQYGSSMMVQIASAYRHLAVDDKAYKCIMAINCIDIWAKAIEMFPTSTDLVFNLLRIMSKISSYPQCCDKLNQKKACLKTLGTFFKVYRSSIHIIIRVSFILANMTSFLSDIRTQLYFDFGAWPEIYGCFAHYADSELKGKSEVEKMGISMAAWDYQAMKKESDIQAIIKIIRLIANIFTVAEIGQDIYVNDSKSFRELVNKLKSLLERKSISNHADLITCILSCLTNVLYYDKEVLLASLQHKNVKTQIVNILVNFVVQIENEEICCESLRVISNITRMKQYVKCVMGVKIHEAVLILLDSTSKEIVYYSLGTIINLLSDQDFKTQYKDDIIVAVIEVLKACESEDFDLVGVCLKVLGTIMGDNIILDPKNLTQIENCLVNLGSHCDRIIMGQGQNQQITSAQESRALINVLLNNMPEERYICPVKNCGRKFADQAKLNQHINRRHKAS